MARVSDLSKAIRDFKNKAIDKDNLNRNKVNDIVRKTILDTVKSMFNTNTDRRFKELFENFDSIQNDLKITDDSYRMNIFVSKDFPIEIDVSNEALNSLAGNDYYKKVDAMQEIMMDIVSCTQEFYEKMTNQNYVYTKNDKSLNETYKSSCLEIGKDFALQIGNGEDKLNAQKRNCNRIANKIVTIEMLKAFKDDNVAKSDIFGRACQIVDEIDDEEISEYNVDGKVYRVSNEEEVIAKNPELLEKYNVLRYGYNNDGSRKSVLEILDYSLDQKKSLTDEENINQVDEITAIRVLSELQMSTNPDAEIAQLVNKYGKEEALKMLNDVNNTISLLNDQQDLKRKIGNDVTEKYKEALKDVEYLDENGNVIVGRFDNEKEKYLDFISEGNYEKVYANININVIGEKTKDTQDPTQVYTQEDNREIERLIDLIQDEQQFNQDRINELIEQNKIDKEERDNFIKILADEHERKIKEMTDQSNKIIGDISNKFNEELKQKDEEIDSLRAKITEIDAESERRIKEEQENYQKQSEELKRNYENLDNERKEEIDRKIEEAEQIANNRIKEIQEEHERERNQYIEEIEKIKEEKESLEQQNSRLNDELSESNNVIEDLKTDINSKEQENIELENELNNANEVINEKNEELKEAKEELDYTKMSLEEINNKLQETNRELEDARNQENLYRERYVEKCREEEELKQRIQSATTAEEKDKLEKKLEDMETSLMLAKQNHDKALVELQEVESRLNDLEDAEKSYDENKVNNIQINNVQVNIEENNTTINNIDIVKEDESEREEDKKEPYEAEYVVLNEDRELPPPSYIELEENKEKNKQVGIDEWIEEKEKIDAKKAEEFNDNSYQMDINEWQEAKKIQDEKAAQQKKQPVSYTQEDNVTIGDIVAENKKKEEELYSKDVSEVQIGMEELDIPDENLYQEVFDMKSEDKYFNFFSDSNNSQKADKIFQELCNEGLSNKEILKTYKERVDFEIEKEHYSSLSEDKKEEYRNEHPDFKEKYIAQLTGLVKTRDEKINKLRHLKDDVLPQVEDLNKETTENRTAMEEMGGKSHG